MGYDALNIQNFGRTKELGKAFQLMVSKTYQITGVGFVACGTVLQGTVSPGTNVHISPFDVSGRIGSIETHNKSLANVRPGHMIGLAIRGLPKMVQQGVHEGHMIYTGNG